MKTLFFSIFIFASLVFAYQPTYKFDKDEVRSQLLTLVNNFQPTDIQFDPAPVPGSKQEALLNFYKKNIVPVNNELSDIILRYLVYDQLIDAGLFESEKQKSQWEVLRDEAYAKYIEYNTSAEWEATQLQLGELAKGLEGALAEVAQMDAAALIFRQNPPELKPLVEELQKLNNEVDDIANRSPHKLVFQKNSALQSQLMADYFDGKIDFATASKQLEELSLSGAYSYGADVFTSATTQLNRIAEIRSIIAKNKGFQTHAELKIAEQSVAHSDKFKSKTQLLKFLEGLLDQTQTVTERYYRVMAKSAGVQDYSKLRYFQGSLLGLPTYLLMRDYFQKEKFDDLWRQTMLESGFPEETLDQIIIDSYPRENKNSHAYMRPILLPTPKVLRINGQSLEPLEMTENQWSPAQIYILQNFDDDGLGNLSTAFHEGGHALDYAYQRDGLGYSTAYGYTETHSTTMESFIEDIEFLMAHGVTREGEALTKERAELFVNRKRVSDLLSFRGNVENAIYDILLWDYDYEKGPLTFTERALKIADEMNDKYAPIKWPEDLSIRPGHGRFVTSHFRSGSVRYFGYVLAEVSAALMSEALLDRLEKSTGRRSLYRQPSIAPILTQEIYREGFKPPFPESIVAFTGKEFSPDNFAKNLVEQVTEFIDGIESKE